MKKKSILIGIATLIILIIITIFLICKLSINSYAINKEKLDKYMNTRGFKEIEEERMGAMLVYSDGIRKEYITYENGEWTSL